MNVISIEDRNFDLFYNAIKNDPHKDQSVRANNARLIAKCWKISDSIAINAFTKSEIERGTYASLYLDTSADNQSAQDLGHD